MSRPTILIVVVMFHLGVLALLLGVFQTPIRVVSAAPPIELVFLKPVTERKVRADNNQPPRVASNVAIDIADDIGPPVATAAMQAGTSSAADGQGSGVNWIAEAHRAVRAYEIRNSQTNNRALSVSSSLDERGFGEHHAGDRSKTESGDWIVWINADCYQIASWHSDASVETAIPQTICRDRAVAAHGN